MHSAAVANVWDYKSISPPFRSERWRLWRGAAHCVFTPKNCQGPKAVLDGNIIIVATRAQLRSPFVALRMCMFSPLNELLCGAKFSCLGGGTLCDRVRHRASLWNILHAAQ